MYKVILKDSSEIELTEEQKKVLEETWLRNKSGCVLEYGELVINLDDIEKFVNE